MTNSSSKNWIKARKAITERQAKSAASTRLLQRYADLAKHIEQVQDQLDNNQDLDTERRLSIELCELQIELLSVENRANELDQELMADLEKPL